MAVAQIGRCVLDEDPAPEKILCDLDVAANDRERLLGERQRQEIGKVRAADRAPGKMLGYEPRADALRQVSQPREVPLVEPVGAAERQPHAVERNRIVAPDRVENHERLSAAHVVLGVHFEPRHRRPFLQHGAVVREAQPDSRRRGDHDAWVLPPAIFWQSPFGSRTKEALSRSCVAWPTQE